MSDERATENSEQIYQLILENNVENLGQLLPEDTSEHDEIITEILVKLALNNEFEPLTIFWAKDSKDTQGNCFQNAVFELGQHGHIEALWQFLTFCPDDINYKCAVIGLDMGNFLADRETALKTFTDMPDHIRRGLAKHFIEQKSEPKIKRDFNVFDFEIFRLQLNLDDEQIRAWIRADHATRVALLQGGDGGSLRFCQSTGLDSDKVQSLKTEMRIFMPYNPYNISTDEKTSGTQEITKVASALSQLSISAVQLPSVNGNDDEPNATVDDEKAKTPSLT